MVIITDIFEMQKTANRLKTEGKTIGFVPTMGFLHEGHLSLIKAARHDCDKVAVSIFVNPIQFGTREDFNTYPRDLPNDSKLIEQAGGDILFTPEAGQMYPKSYGTCITVKGLDENLCGRFRPGHFQGVTTIVGKLFNLVKPDIAYFGQKDYQQLTLLKKMTFDLNFEIQIKGQPTVREKDGLAMSSRNTYLDPRERQAALCLYQAICLAQEMRKKGITKSSQIITAIKQIMEAEPLVQPQYIQICHPETLQDLEFIEDSALLAMAVYIGKTRLIDNALL